MKAILIAIGFISGCASAWFWWKSATIEYKFIAVPGDLQTTHSSGDKTPNAESIRQYLGAGGKKNKWAAGLGALSATANVLASGC